MIGIVGIIPSAWHKNSLIYLEKIQLVFLNVKAHTGCLLMSLKEYDARINTLTWTVIVGDVTHGAERWRTWQRTSEDRLSRLRTFLSYHESIRPSMWAISVESSNTPPLHSWNNTRTQGNTGIIFNYSLLLTCLWKVVSSNDFWILDSDWSIFLLSGVCYYLIADCC